MPTAVSYPGVYIEELPSGVHTITGVSTSVTAFLGFFKRGTYLQRRTFDRTLTDEERARIPEAHRPPADATVQRTHS